jgi:hypothetical protein
MSSTTLLGLFQQAIPQMGLTTPTSVIGNNALDTVQSLALLNAVGNEISREWQWQALTKEFRTTTIFYAYTGSLSQGQVTVTGMSTTAGLTAAPTTFMVVGNGVNQDTYVSSAGTSQAILTQAASASVSGATLTFSQTKYAMPTDYDRLIDRTDWDKSKHWEMLGPETAQQWQWLKSGYISTGPRIRYRVMGDTFQIWPPLGTNEYIGFEYVSNAWVSTAFGTAPTKTSFTLDTDVCIFPDVLMVLGLKKKYFEIKGFDVTALTRDYMAQLNIAKAADAGSPNLSMAPRRSQVLIGWENIPDSNYGT